uniref:Uncharacterized protein n=1 Tax=Anguilla anguilla TaxID=7936 RepID=A0A0E9QU55_ANGAN
MIKLIKNTD